jgi:glycosyltransferase involved in cell wall biosynthesis
MFSPSADGGMARYSRELLTALADQSGRACRCELLSSEDLAAPFRAERYPVHPILPALRHRDTFRTKIGWVASRLTHYPRRDWRFLKWLKGRPDVSAVHFQELTPWLAPHLFRRIRNLGKSIFYTVHNVLPHRYPAMVPKWLMHRWIRQICRLCNGLFVHTGRLSSELSDFLGQPHPPIHIVPHGVWNVPENVNVPPLSQRLATRRLLFFGSIRRNKGLHLLLSAMERLADFSVTIAGEPQEPDYHRDQILPHVRRLRDAGVRIDLRDRWTPEDEIGRLFTTHSAVVMPYTSDFVAQSGVLFMALAYQIPVVATLAGGIRELMNDCRIGTTITSETPDTVANAILDLHQTDDIDALERCLAAAKQRHSWRQAAEQTLAGYLAVPQQQRTPSVDCTAQTIPAA